MCGKLSGTDRGQLLAGGDGADIAVLRLPRLGRYGRAYNVPSPAHLHLVVGLKECRGGFGHVENEG